MMFRTICSALAEMAWCLAWLFLWPDGRISRRAYAFGCMVVVAVFVFVLWSADPARTPGIQTQNKIDQGSLALLIACTAWTTFAIYIKRLHDCGISFFNSTLLIQLFSLALCIPLLGVMLFWPGDEEYNKYGEPFSILKSIRNEIR
jgi:uncharacterized membrane protein YhaH (DUF805 family)